MIKKIALFFLFICVFSWIVLTYFYNKPLFRCDSGVYTFYLYSPSSNAEIITVDASQARECAKRLVNIRGEGLFLDFTSNGEERCMIVINEEIEDKKARLLFSECGEWGSCYYYYTPQIADFCVINGEKVNLHVVVGENSISIGSPIIFGSF